MPNSLGTIGANVWALAPLIPNSPASEPSAARSATPDMRTLARATS